MSRLVGVLQFGLQPARPYQYLFVPFLKSKDFTSLAIKHITTSRESAAGWKSLYDEGLDRHYTPFRLEVIYDD